METLDLKKALKPYISPKHGEFRHLTIPAFNFLMVDGHGDPAVSPDYMAAIEALYTSAYTLKFSVKKGPLAVDYPVMPLEGLWWADNMDFFIPGSVDRNAWKWTAMILLPDFIDTAMAEDARMAALEKKKDNPALRILRFERFDEGLVAQTMHLGPYSEEGPVIEALHRFIEDQGGSLTGRHHEIYLSDPNRTDPSKLKTIIRQPFVPSATT